MFSLLRTFSQSVETWASVIIGICSGFFYLLGSKLLIRYRIDDAVDAIPVHCVGGAWGVIATGLLSKGTLLKAAFGQDEHIGWCKCRNPIWLEITQTLFVAYPFFSVFCSLRVGPWKRQLHSNGYPVNRCFVHFCLDVHPYG